MEAAKSNFLQYNVVPLYQLTPVGAIGLPSCFGRSRGTGTASEAMRTAVLMVYSSAATSSCRSLRKIPAVIMNLGQSLRKVLSYLLHFSSGLLEETILATRLWLGSRGSWLWRAQYAQSYASAQFECWFYSQTGFTPKLLKNFRVLEKSLQLKGFWKFFFEDTSLVSIS